MALTPEDVSSKRFTTVRLREGYDMTEVDQFLDEVESELSRILRENDQLQAKLSAVLAGEPMPEFPEETDAAEPRSEDAADAQASSEQAPASDVSSAPVHGGPLEPVTTVAQASVAATRLLELAGSNADQLVSEAQAEAEQIVDQSRSRAEAMEAEARGRAEALEAETEERRASLLGDIEQEKVRLDNEIEALRTFEREYRAELKTYFEDQLAALEGQGTGVVLGRSERADQSAAEDEQGEQPAHGEQLQQGEQTRLQSLLSDDER